MAAEITALELTGRTGWIEKRAGPPLYLLIPAVLVALAALSPVAYLVIRLSEAGDRGIDLILRDSTLRTLIRSLVLASIVTTGTVLIAVPLAWLTVRTDLPFRRAWAVITTLPLVIPSYVGAFTVVEALGPKGLLQKALEGPLGVQRLPEIYGLPGASFTLILLTYPYVLLSARTALWGMDPALEESARSMGSRPFAAFVRVTLPQLRPAIAAGALLVALYTLSDFGAVSLLRYLSFTNVIYQQYESAFDRTLAAASALVLVAVAVVLLGLELWTRGRSRYYRSNAGANRRPATVRLGAWRWPAFGFCLVVASLALCLPVGVLLYWALKGVAAGESFAPVWSAAWGSFRASAFAAGVTTLAAIPVALVTVRYAGRATAVIERVSYLGFGLPGIVVALSMVFFGIRFAPALYQTMTILVLAYAIIFLPVALGALRTALLQVNPHFEEAARSLGKAPPAVFFQVTLPLVRTGLIAGAALVFLVTMKELPATLILGPIGFKTLATTTWSAASAALQAQAAFSALMLIAVSAVPMAVMIYRERRDQW
jgi:iron(III) transport system permease protein